MDQSDIPKSPPVPHELHEFMNAAQRRMQEAYDQIQKRAKEDPGTAGDQAEENWAELLRKWLPPYFQVVTKGRILTSSGRASNQVDVLILTPAYPKGLLSEKLYMAAGVAAAFECKTTLKAEHIRSAIATAAEIRRAMPTPYGSPYKELNSPPIFGLLAHSHSWKSDNSTPLANVGRALADSDREYVRHPREMMDIVCVADLGGWSSVKINYLRPAVFPPGLASAHAGRASSGYICHASNSQLQTPYFSPVGTLISIIYHKLAWTFPDMRSFDEYFRQINLMGSGEGATRYWDVTIYSESIREQVTRGLFQGGKHFDEWSPVFI